MDELARRILTAAGILGALGVAIGAFGAHGLETQLAASDYSPELIQKRLTQFDTGTRYHLIHAVALLAVSALGNVKPSLRRMTAWLFSLGIVFFSGSLYLLVLTGQTKLGMITPIGGLMWISAWVTLAVAARRVNPLSS